MDRGWKHWNIKLNKRIIEILYLLFINNRTLHCIIRLNKSCFKKIPLKWFGQRDRDDPPELDSLSAPTVLNQFSETVTSGKGMISKGFLLWNWNISLDGEKVTFQIKVGRGINFIPSLPQNFKISKKTEKKYLKIHPLKANKTDF